MKEIHFKQHWRTIALAFIVVLGFEALLFFFQKQLWEKRDFLGILVTLFIVVLCLFGFLYPFILNRKIIFYDEGISFIHLFRRKFMRWEEIEEMSDISRNQYPIILLKSKIGKAKIHLSEFEEKDKIVAFLDEKIFQKQL